MKPFTLHSDQVHGNNVTFQDIKTLKSQYKSVEDIDYYIGGLLEKPLPDGTVGQSFACIQAESFYRWKFGDRLFYEFPTAKFTPGRHQLLF